MASLNLLAPGGFCPARFSLERVSTGFSSRSQVSGLLQVRPTLGWHWRGSMTFPPARPDRMAALEGAMHAWGLGDSMEFGHPLRPIPRGTLRGSPLVSTTHAAGSRTLRINSPINGRTLLAGDLIKVVGCLYMVAQDVTLIGPTDVALSGSLLTPVANNTSVIWDHPTLDWVRAAPIRITYVPGIGEAIEVDFEEAR